MNARGSTEVIVATHRPVDGRAQPEPVHDDRRHGGRHHHGDAADAALGLARLPLSEEEKRAAGARGVRGEGLRARTRAAAARRGRQPERQVRRPPRRPARRPARHADHRAAARDGGKPTSREKGDDRAKRRPTATYPERRADRGRSARNEDEADDLLGRRTITVREPRKPTDEAIATEAKKGYDLLFVGTKNARTTVRRVFRPRSRASPTAFEGPIALVVGRDEHLEDPQSMSQEHLGAGRRHRRVTARGRSRNRDCACLRMSDHRALCRQSRKPASGVAQVFRRASRTGIIKEIVAMADHYDVEVRTHHACRCCAGQGIIAAAKKGKHDLIIMGVSRRPGDTCSSAIPPPAIFDDAPTSIVFVAT